MNKRQETKHGESARIGDDVPRESADPTELETRVETSHMKYARLFELAPVGYLTLDENCRIVDANALAREMLAMPGEALTGKPLAQLLVPEARAGFEEACRLAAKERGRLRFEAEVVHNAGRGFTALLEGGVLHDVDDSVHLLLVVTDVTERKAAEALLQQSHENLRLLFELSQDGVVITNSEKRIVRANPAACTILGRPVESLEGAHIDEVKAAPDQPTSSDLFDRVSVAESLQGEYSFIRPDGVMRTITFNARAISEGRFVAFFRDITEQRRAEEQLLTYSEHLEDLVELRAERIRELERNRVQSEQLASTGRMAARIAHEINNPLAGIKNSFLLIKDAIPEDYPYFRYVGAIQKEIDRIARIVSQMFDLYQPEQEQPQRFSVGETVEDVVLLLEPLSRQRQVNVTARQPEYPMILFQPEGLVRQVLYNLIANAIEASPPGETVRITAVPVGENVSISVTDHGRGISEEVAAHLFEPFFTTKRAGFEEGVGLGLSVSRTLVELMRGTLSYQSKVGEGSVFRMILPHSVQG